MVSVKLCAAVVLMAVLVGVNTTRLCAMPDPITGLCPGGSSCLGYNGCFCSFAVKSPAMREDYAVLVKVTLARTNESKRYNLYYVIIYLYIA